MNANTTPMVASVKEACEYYGAMFDSLDTTVSRDNSNRIRIEEGLGRKMCNSVAYEGRDRVDRCEVFGKWRARLSMAGFQIFNPDPLEELNEKRTGVVQMVMLAKKERDSLEGVKNEAEAFMLKELSLLKWKEKATMLASEDNANKIEELHD